MARLCAMLASDAVRRMAAVPNHYERGNRANAKSASVLGDDSVSALGCKVGALEFFSHRHLRPGSRKKTMQYIPSTPYLY